MSKKADLKTAMESLQVCKPLRLPSRAPAFTPPAPSVPAVTAVATETQVPPTTQVVTETLVSAATLALSTTEVSEESPIIPGAPVGEPTPVSEPAPVSLDTLVAKESQVPVKTWVSTKTQAPGTTQVASRPPRESSAGSQDSSVVLESQTASKLHNGYTRLPNAALMRIVGGELLRSEIQVLLLIARFTISFQRRHAPLSKAVIERQTGLRGPAVLQAVADLIAKGLVEKIPGDQYRPNLLGLKFDESWDFFEKGPLGQAEPKVALSTQVSTATPALAPAATTAGVAAGTYFKDKEIYKNKNSLSSLPPVLQDYFSEVKPEKKRASEWRSFQDISGEYSPGEIAECFSLIDTRGIPATRNGVEAFERCHSPMAFLSKAIGTVSAEIQAKRAKTQERELREQREAAEQRKRAEAEAQEALDWLVKERVFEQSFPSETVQQEILSKFLRIGEMPFKSNTSAGRAFGIARWWESLSDAEKIQPAESC